MHRRVRDKLEDILAGGHALARGHAEERHRHDAHLDECVECRETIAAMRDQQRLLRSLRLPEEAEPRAGFYARVIERIESQGAASIWSLFFDSAAGRGLAMASMVLALSLGVYLVSSERLAAPTDIRATPGQLMPGSGDSAGMLTGSPDRNAVLFNLVTYREQ
jgi:predicted anti-sigma-YlaC factor YlaD